MQRILRLLFLVTMLVLVACGGSNGDDENTTNNTTDSTTQNENTSSTSKAGFSATISGATDARVSGSGYFQCDDVGDGELTVGAAFSMSDNILILFPEDTQPGTYDLSSDFDSEYTASYVGEDLMTAMYEENVSGTLTLDEIARATGETVRGSFEFEASTSEGETVNVDGSFDFTAGENAYYNCTQTG